MSSTPANKGKTLPPEPLTAAEVEALMSQCRGDRPLAVRNRAWIALVWRSGIRAAESLRIKPADLDLDQGTIRVLVGKGKKTRVITFDRPAVEPLRTWLAVRAGLGLNGRQPVFCTVSSGRVRQPGDPLDPAYFRALLPKLGAAAEIDKRVHPHGLRHSLASDLAREGVPLPAISAQLGHTSIATTDRYVRALTADELLADVRRFRPI